MANQIPDIKKFMLRALLVCDAEPMPQSALTDACLNGISPRPLMSDITQARRDLEYIHCMIGITDEVTGSNAWALTAKGTMYAKM